MEELGVGEIEFSLGHWFRVCGDATYDLGKTKPLCKLLFVLVNGAQQIYLQGSYKKQIEKSSGVT